MKIFKALYFPLLITFSLAVFPAAAFAQGDVDIKAIVDNEDPTITTTNPNDGDTVSGSVEVTANAGDDGGITKVEFFIDGFLKLTDTTSPYTFSWDTKAVSNGSHTITAKAYDIVNNTVTDTITVTVNNVTMTSPTKKLTPLAPVTPVSEKPKQEEEEKRKFLIFPNLPGISLVEALIDFFRANINFFFGFLFALELLIVFFLVKKIRQLRKKEEKQQRKPSTPMSPQQPISQ